VRRFDDDRVAARVLAALDERADLLERVALALGPGHDGHVVGDRQGARQRLVAELVEDGRLGADKRDPVRLAEAREVHVLRQEAIPGVDRVHVVGQRRLHDLLVAEVPTRKSFPFRAFRAFRRDAAPPDAPTGDAFAPTM